MREALPDLIHVPFEFDAAGSQIIFYQPERGYDREEALRAQQPVPEFRELSEMTAGAPPLVKAETV